MLYSLLMGMFLLLCFACCTLSSQMKIIIPLVNNTLHLGSCFHPNSSKPSTNMTSFIFLCSQEGGTPVSQPEKGKPYSYSLPNRFSEAKVLIKHFHYSQLQIRGRILLLSLPKLTLCPQQITRTARGPGLPCLCWASTAVPCKW